MRRRLLFLFVGILLSVNNLSALQDKSSVIWGRVTDNSGNYLPGAGITIENTFLGVYTNADGTYLFKGLKDGVYTLRFSFVGYRSQIHEIRLEGESIMNVSLVPETLMTGEVIVNASRAGSRTPLAYTTVENENLTRQNSGQDIPFLLSLTPSLVETSEAGNGIGYTSLRIRGTDASRINVTIDGIPLNDPESQQVFWVDLPDLASSVENIQVQRGAGTSTNGAGAFGATVSIQTKNPENEPFAQISTSFGSFNTSKRMIAAGTGILDERFAFQIRLSEMKSDGFIDRSGSDHKSAYISGIYRTDKSRLKANIILGKEHTGIGWWGVPEDLLTVNRRYNPAGEYTDENGLIHYYNNESDNYNQNHYQLIYNRNLLKNLTFSAALHYTRGSGYYEEYKEGKKLAKYGLPAITTGDTIIKSTDLISRKWMSNDFYGLVWSFKYRKEKLDATFGGGANYYDGDHFGRIIWMKSPGSTEKDHQWYFNNGTKGEFSFFGKVEYAITYKISVYGDLQYRYINYKLTGNDDDLKNIEQEHHFGFFNPKAGFFLSIAPDQDAYISFSVANREPTRADFKEAAGDPDAAPRPETLYDSELGYKLRGEKYSLAVNLYGMFYKDQLVPTGELSNVGYSIMTNVKKSSRIGLELNAGIKPFNFLTWNSGITLSSNKINNFTEHYINYVSIDSTEEYKIKNLGSVDIAYSPSVIATSDLNFRISEILELHFISKYVGKQYFDNTMNQERMIDPYFVNNLRIDFNPRISGIRGTEFQLLINNFFNSLYESNAYGGNSYADNIEYSWSNYFPQAGTNFMVKAGLTF
ncbi:MAG: TonB-dependent receptor [Bacteroidales bacterium]|jgi:iron complex outermembrane receptor protein|nr:TonB-dependent receptor [Bacteroidales bacterium]